MYKLCKTESATKRQREIEKELFAMICEVGYEDVTVTELCLRMGLQRKTFYRYFDSKDAAFSALVEHTLSEYSGFHKDVRRGQRSLTAELEEYFKFWYKNRALLDVFAKNDLLARLMEISINYPVSDRISIKKFFREEDDATLQHMLRFAIGGLNTIMLDWYKRGFNESFSTMAGYACRALSRPLFPDLSIFGIL